MTSTDFVRESDAQERAIKDAYRKEHGVYFTPYPLAAAMVANLKLPTSAVIFDPCCGSGVFLYAAEQLGYTNICGTDLNADFVRFCMNHVPKAVCLVADTLTHTALRTLRALPIAAPPDVIVGNPPYVPIRSGQFTPDDEAFRREVSENGSNLFVAGLLRSLDLVKAGGIVSYVIPKTVLHVSTYKNLRQRLLRDHTILSIADVGAHFHNVRGEQIVLTLVNKPAPPGHCIKMMEYVDEAFVPLCTVQQGIFSDAIQLFRSDTDVEIHFLLSQLNRESLDAWDVRIKRGRSKEHNAIRGKDIRKFGLRECDVSPGGLRVFIQNIYSSESGVIATRGGNLPATETVTVCAQNDEDASLFLLGLLHSKVANYYLHEFCYNGSTLTMHTDAQYLKRLPLPPASTCKQDRQKIVHMSKCLENLPYRSTKWFEALSELDEVVFRVYGLHESHQNHIEQRIEAVQSERWHNGRTVQ